MAKLSGITATNITYQEAAAPSTPASTKWVSYFKTDGQYYKDDAGVETGPLGAASAPGSTIVGRVAFAAAPGVTVNTDFSASSFTMNAVSAGTGGAVAVQVVVPAPMYLDSYAMYNSSTSAARAGEIRLYKDTGSTSLAFVTGSDATISFTPSAASKQASSAVSGAPVLLDPGWYWVAVRNTSTSQTLVIGSTAVATIVMTASVGVTSASGIAALGSTLDPTTTFAKGNRINGIILVGRIMGQGSAW